MPDMTVREMNPYAKTMILLRRVLHERSRRGRGLADVVALFGHDDVKMVSAVARLLPDQQQAKLSEAARAVNAQALAAVYEGLDTDGERRVCCVLIERDAAPRGWVVDPSEGATIRSVTDDAALAMANAIPSLLGVLT